MKAILAIHNLNYFGYTGVTSYCKDKGMAPEEIAQKCIADCKANKSLWLDLSGLGLKEIPQEVGELVWLQRLSLSRNDIDTIDVLAPLTQLHKLAFSYNRISDLSPLSENERLKFLFMKHNRVKSVDVLGRLFALKKIDAHHNHIENIDALVDLPKLVYLDVSYNSIENLEVVKKMKFKWFNGKSQGVVGDP